jgi:hypothetical protein
MGTEKGDFDALAPGGQAYFYADVPRSKPILKLITLNGFTVEQAADVLDRTNSAAGAFYPPGSPRRFLLESRGSYPQGRGRFSLSLSSAWKRIRSPSGKSYYHSPDYGFSLVLEKDRLLLSDQDPYAEGGVMPPERLGELRREAVLAGWMENAGEPVNKFLSGLDIPIQVPTERVLFGIYEAEKEDLPVRKPGRFYTAVIRIETPSANQARALSVLVSMARMVMSGYHLPNGDSLMAVVTALFANPPDQDGQDLIIRTGPLEAGEIALLFGRFSVYSESISSP